MTLPEEENTPEKRVNRIFSVMDKVSPLTPKNKANKIFFCYG